MSVESIQDSLDKVVVAFSAALTRSTPNRELFDSMLAELEQIQLANVPDGKAITRAANAIFFSPFVVGYGRLTGPFTVTFAVN